MSKNQLSLCTFTTAFLFFTHNANSNTANTNAANTNVAHTNAANSNVKPPREDIFTCNENAPSYRCNDGKKHDISHRTYNPGKDIYGAITASKKNTSINAENVTIDGVNISSNLNSEESGLRYGVRIFEEGKVSLKKSKLKGVSIGVDVDYGTFEMDIGLIEATRRGVSVGGRQSLITLTNSKIEMGTNAIGLFSHNNAKVKMEGGSIDVTDGIGAQAAGSGEITLNKVLVTEKSNQMRSPDGSDKNAALHMLQGNSRINLYKSTVDAVNAHGLLLEGIANHADIKNSAFIVKGNTSLYGMGFFWETAFNGNKTFQAGRGSVNLKKTMFIAPSGIAIYSRKFGSTVQLSEGSTVFGDLLLKAEDTSSVKINADASILVGKAYIDDSSTAEITLTNNSKWVLSRPAGREIQELLSKNLNSMHISSIYLDNSSVHFDKIESNKASDYQTLRIGKGVGTVYTAKGKARLYLNTCLGEGGDIQRQKTDRLLIHGDVAGETTVYVQGVPIRLGHPGKSTGKGNNKGISLIQVSGNATKDSFKLAGGYTVFVGSPYQYHLVAYGPSSTLGLANSDQRLVEGTKPFWDFRLESKAVLPYVPPVVDPDESNNTFIDDVLNSVTNVNPDDTGSDVGSSSTESDPNINVSSIHPTIIDIPIIPPSIPDTGSTFMTPDFPPTSFDPITPPSTVPDTGSTFMTPDVPSTSSDPIAPPSTVPDTGSTFMTPDVPPTSSDPHATVVTSTVLVKPESDEFPIRPTDSSTSNTDSVLVRPTAPTVSEFDTIPVTSSASVPAVSEPNSPAISPVRPSLISVLQHVASLDNNVRAVVPQIPTYLLLPNFLLHSGLMDINNQNKQLETMRTISSRLLKIDKNPALFIHGYGGHHRYNSDLSLLEYGYSGDLDYNAVEAGAVLKTIENIYGIISFGVMGNYGKFSLQPLNVKQSQKSIFDKWSVTAYGSLECDTGFYVDGLLSYGLFKGDVFTLARNKTASLKGNPLSTSLTAGRAFTTEDASIVFDPQVQFIYQLFQFNKARDIDGFDINMGKPDQLTMRVGGHLTKTLSVTKEAHIISFYGKLHLTHNFENKHSVYFKDAFQLGASGSSLEAGLGFNAQLLPKLTLYGDLAYQHKLTKAGFMGTTFSGGLSYRF
ncbi:autotransporter outer membrane beta-barrel domain-containing protein [Bartonella sp. CB189]|uniref:autotransporter outer membrane beta-barrel domain-containing protein n=1 Tax=Bartonella sp. CB189 TaxID=3112254 RepID=UPI002F96A09E